ARRVEPGLVVKQTAAAQRKDIVVVADRDIVDCKGGASDFVRADPRLATGGAQGGEITRVVVDQVPPGEPAARPARFDIGEVGAAFAYALKRMVDAVLAFVAHMPRGD